jgi:hypothetical protein
MSNRLAEQVAWQQLTPKQKRGILAIKENAVIRDGVIYDSLGNDQSHRVELIASVSEEQREGLQAVDELSSHEIENGLFVFAFFESCKTMGEQYASLTQADLARLMFVGTYTGYRTGRLQHDNGRVIDKKALEDLLGMSRNKFGEFYRKLLAEGILQEVSDELFVNPSVFYRGPVKEIGYELDEYRHTRLFRKTVRDLYEKYTGRKTAQLALIYAVLPFLNFDTNVVCFNPREADDDSLKPMNLENLAALLNYKDTHKLKRALESVKIDGQPVFWLPSNVHDKRHRRVIVNPRVVFAGNAESLKAVKLLFS